jgi:hypothetical protein
MTRACTNIARGMRARLDSPERGALRAMGATLLHYDETRV